MTLAVVGAMATSPVKIRNVGSWRVKETERMKAIVTELEKLGVAVSESCSQHHAQSSVDYVMHAFFEGTRMMLLELTPCRCDTLHLRSLLWGACFRHYVPSIFELFLL